MEQLFETTRLLAEVTRVAALQPKDRLQDSWCRALMRQPGARRHLDNLQGLPAHVAQASYVAMVVGCFLSLDDSMPAPLPVSRPKAGRIRAAARKLDDEVEGVAALSSTVAQPEFRAALDQLRVFFPPENVPVRTRKGNPERRQFIWTVAEAFYGHFECFHIEAIGEIVAMRWQETDVRIVRLELTDERLGKIAEQAKKRTLASGKAATATAAALTRAQRKVGGVAEDVRTDAQRIGDALAALNGMADRELGASLVQGLQSILADFDYQHPEG
ncbi:hypothetical protein [Cupriavidus sp. AcVe19-1a]|uniref:hypothetical protein n=1 Tax=Cupriavidus sp. AcVe19-1a TaxID=2821359 RepID=UPI001AE8794C|nr:hypothetical protein [Cupriavidus sp. AcVe19-1a]MBP0633185.1 hypothetical protein [Cupriavidus sp. AcVe19-1a]